MSGRYMLAHHSAELRSAMAGLRFYREMRAIGSLRTESVRCAAWTVRYHKRQIRRIRRSIASGASL